MGLFSRSNIYLLGFLGSVFQSAFKGRIRTTFYIYIYIYPVQPTPHI